MIAFLAAVIAMTLIAVALIVVPLVRDPATRSPIAGVVATLAVAAVVTLLYPLVSTYSWTGTPAAEPADAAQATTADIETLRDQALADPGDADGWMRLAEAYLGQERFSEARESYARALEASGSAASDELRLSFAETAILADRNALAGEAGRIVDEVLQREASNPRALWYGGMAALARGDGAMARDRWTKLLELGPPPQVRDVIEQQLAAIDGTPAEQGASVAAGAVTIPLRVSIKPELASRVRPGAALFVIARAAGEGGPPIAVVRRDSASLPLDLEISDADSMVPGRTMARLGEVKVTARIANDGEALPATGDVFGEATWSAGLGDGERLPILMDQVVR